MKNVLRCSLIVLLILTGNAIDNRSYAATPVMQTAPADTWNKELEDQFENHLYDRFIRSVTTALSDEQRSLFRQLSFCIVQKITHKYTPGQFRSLGQAETEHVCKELLELCGAELHIDLQNGTPLL